MYMLSYEIWRDDGGGKVAANKTFDRLIDLVTWAKNSKVWKGSVFKLSPSEFGAVKMEFVDSLISLKVSDAVAQRP